MLWRNDFLKNIFAHLHRIFSPVLHQLNKPVNVLQAGSFPTEKNTFLQKGFWGMYPNPKSLLPHEEKKKTERELEHEFLFQLFFLRSLNYRILKINLEDIAMNFWSSWKRNHKTSDYNQQSVITAEPIRPILKKPNPTALPSWAFSIERGMSHNTIQTRSLSILGSENIVLVIVPKWQTSTDGEQEDLTSTVLLIPPDKFCSATPTCTRLWPGYYNNTSSSSRSLPFGGLDHFSLPVFLWLW